MDPMDQELSSDADSQGQHAPPPTLATEQSGRGQSGQQSIASSAFPPFSSQSLPGGNAYSETTTPVGTDDIMAMQQLRRQQQQLMAQVMSPRPQRPLPPPSAWASAAAATATEGVGGVPSGQRTVGPPPAPPPHSSSSTASALLRLAMATASLARGESRGAHSTLHQLAEVDGRSSPSEVQ